MPVPAPGKRRKGIRFGPIFFAIKQYFIELITSSIDDSKLSFLTPSPQGDSQKTLKAPQENLTIARNKPLLL